MHFTYAKILEIEKIVDDLEVTSAISRVNIGECLLNGGKKGSILQLLTTDQQFVPSNGYNCGSKVLVQSQEAQNNILALCRVSIAAIVDEVCSV